MAPIDDDLDIRAALADLTEGQPPVPPERLAAVRRRAGARRRGGIVVSAVAGVAAVAITVSLATLPRGSEQPAARRAANWLPWPDHRNGSVPKSDLNYAVLSWHLRMAGIVSTGQRVTPAEHAAYTAPYRVTWYLAQTIDRGRFVVVMFEAHRLGKTQVVFGYAPASRLVAYRWPPGPVVGRGPWVLTIAPAPDPQTRYLTLGGYVNAGTSEDPDDWIVVLTAPDIQRITWVATTRLHRTRATTSASTGLAVADAGQLTAPVRLTGMSTSHGLVSLGNAPVVGGPAAVPAIAPPTMEFPAVLVRIIGAAEGQGSKTVPLSHSFKPGHARYVIIAACHGPEGLSVAVNGHHIATIACNAAPARPGPWPRKQRQFTVPASVLRARGLTITVDTGKLTAWRLGLVAF